MIDDGTLLTYLLVLLGFMFIPGPAMMLTLARALSAGPRAGLATGAGIAAGDLVHTAMAVIGLSTVIANSALAFTVVKIVGAAYLVYLGVCAIREPRGAQIAAESAVYPSPAAAFRQAVIAEILNPKSAMFFLAFLPQFVDPERGQIVGQLALLGVLFVMMGLLATSVMALGAGHLGRWLRRHPVVLSLQGKVVGSIYCALGLRSALQEP